MKKRKLANNCKKGHDKDVFFKASYRIQGVFVNLGTHQSSASVAAAVDLAHILYSEDGTPKEELQVLSQVEANLALRSAKARKLPSPNNPNEFIPFNEERKKTFEYDIEKALSCIGGEDESLSLILCSIDKKSQRQAVILFKKAEI